MKIITIVAVLVACSGSKHEQREAVRTIEPVIEPAQIAPAVQASADEPSIYELELPLRDANGVDIRLDVDRGHPTLISMFYGSCAVACPALIGYLKQLTDQTGDDTRVLLVSFDPARDTPARLRELTATYGLDARWTLGSANATTARTLAAVLGIKYRAMPSGEFFHNTVIVAVDHDGRPLMRMNGLGDGKDLVAALVSRL